MSQVYVAKSEPIKLTAFLYPTENYILVTDELNRYRLFCPFSYTAEKVDEVDGRTYFEANQSNPDVTIANLFIAEKKNDSNQA